MALTDTAKQALAVPQKKLTFVAHPYTFRIGNKEFKPNKDGFYEPKTPEEVAEFEHFIMKGFVQKV